MSLVTDGSQKSWRDRKNLRLWTELSTYRRKTILGTVKALSLSGEGLVQVGEVAQKTFEMDALLNEELEPL